MSTGLVDAKGVDLAQGILLQPVIEIGVGDEKKISKGRAAAAVVNEEIKRLTAPVPEEVVKRRVHWWHRAMAWYSNKVWIRGISFGVGAMLFLESAAVLAVACFDADVSVVPLMYWCTFGGLLLFSNAVSLWIYLKKTDWCHRCYSEKIWSGKLCWSCFRDDLAMAEEAVVRTREAVARAENLGLLQQVTAQIRGYATRFPKGLRDLVSQAQGNILENTLARELGGLGVFVRRVDPGDYRVVELNNGEMPLSLEALHVLGEGHEVLGRLPIIESVHMGQLRQREDPVLLVKTRVGPFEDWFVIYSWE